jgi:hypothetical protein
MQNYILETSKWRSQIGSPVANPKSGPVYSVRITKFFSVNFTYPVRCFRVPPGVRVTEVEDHCSKAISQISLVWLTVVCKQIIWLPSDPHPLEQIWEFSRASIQHEGCYWHLVKRCIERERRLYCNRNFRWSSRVPPSPPESEFRRNCRCFL